MAVLLLGGAALLVPQIILRIQGKDGKETTYQVPEGSDIKVEPNGNVTVTLPPSPEKPAARPQPASVVIPPVLHNLPIGAPLSVLIRITREDLSLNWEASRGEIWTAGAIRGGCSPRVKRSAPRWRFPS